MTFIFVALNIIFAISMWNASSEAFKQNRNGLGWFLIAASAANGASAAVFFL